MTIPSRIVNHCVKMVQELSSNWKKLQAKIKAEASPSSSSATTTPASKKPTASKRKPEEARAGPSAALKRRKLGNPVGSVAAQARALRRELAPATPPAQRKTPMGVTQSSAVTRGTSATITPSLALWAEDNDISPEDLAEAYNLGIKDNALLQPSSGSGRPSSSLPSSAAEEDKARANEGLAPADVIAALGRYVAIDCEMVGCGPEGRESILARVSAVDFHGRQVYDSLVRPRAGDRVTDFRTRFTGLTGMRDFARAREFDVVQADVIKLLSGNDNGNGNGNGGSKGRILVGHDIRHDLAALELAGWLPGDRVRDTARSAVYKGYGHGRKPALRVLAREVLGVEIQGGAHSSLEDARVAMLLFRRKKPEFDVEHAAKYGRRLLQRAAEGEEEGKGGAKGGSRMTKKKKKRKK